MRRIFWYAQSKAISGQTVASPWRKNGKGKIKAMKMCGTQEESVRDELVSLHFVVAGFCGRG